MLASELSLDLGLEIWEFGSGFDRFSRVFHPFSKSKIHRPNKFSAK